MNYEPKLFLGEALRPSLLAKPIIRLSQVVGCVRILCFPWLVTVSWRLKLMYQMYLQNRLL